MSRKHNAPHPNRGRSNYKERLQRRGLSSTPMMEDPDRLKARQENEKLRLAWTTSTPKEDGDGA